jgi:lauroyl/myristoyl acyltransferase
LGLRRRAPYLAYRVGAVVANALPGPAAVLAVRLAGLGAALVMPGRRAVVARHLWRVYGPELDGLALKAKVASTFGSYARYWLESFRLPSMDAGELAAQMTSWEGLGHLEDALERGRGAIVAMPHLGGWDFGGAWLASVGYPATVVVEALEPPELFAWFIALRRSLGLTVVPHDNAAGPVLLRALRADQVVALVCDRDLTGSGAAVDFFGERTTLPAGPATLAIRTAAAILPTAVYFDGSGHHGVMRPPVPVERTGSLRADVARITQLLAAELESLIRRAPEQWHLLQPNWPSDPGYRR